MTVTVAVIGLGRMGLPIAERLYRNGINVIATSRSAETRENARKAGFAVVDAIPQAVAAASTLLVSVFDTAALTATLTGTEGIFASARKGTVIVDLGTSDVDETKQLAAEAEKQGYFYVDAPVSGGTRGAEGGTLTIMAGGRPEAIAQAQPILDILGRTNHMGQSGSGQSTKLVNQLILGETLVAVAEGLNLAIALGLEPGRVREALLGGFAESRVLREHGQRMVDQNFEPGGSVAVFSKDLGLVEKASAQLPVSFPGFDVARSVYRRAVETGLSNRDQSIIFECYKDGTGGRL